MSKSFSGANVVVTGGAGFIGSELVTQLSALGASVTAVDNLANGKRENLSHVLDSGVELSVTDVREIEKMSALIRGADVVFHLACLGVRHSIHSPYENHEVNATATLKLLEAAREGVVGRFVYVSSSEVYGTARTTPMSELHPTYPTTVYGGAKLAGESYTRAYFETYRYPTVIVRPFNAYGPRSHHEGDSGEVIPKFMLRAMAGLPMIVFGDGTQARDFTFVSDTARGIAAAGSAESVVGETINLAAGKEITVRALADEVRSALGLPYAPIDHQAARPGDVLRLLGDGTKARNLLGYSPTVAFRDGLRALRDWYASRRESPVELLQSESVRNWETGNAS